MISFSKQLIEYVNYKNVHKINC